MKEGATMPIGKPKMIKCPKCKKKILVMIGDVRPQKMNCPSCGYVWFYK